MKIAVIGAGISGITIAQMLSKRNQVTVFEKSDSIGGLIRCDLLEQGLYHKLGGHVFNTKTSVVADWFWQFFDRNKDFYLCKRNAKIFLDGKVVGYPIENHIYQLSNEIIYSILSDLLQKENKGKRADNFKEFLEQTFGKTLCELYFFPYNKKIWGNDLAKIPLGWLEGKLPMPDLFTIVHSNFTRKPESEMVHSNFYYAKQNGSQYIVNRLAEGLDVRLNASVNQLIYQERKWRLNNSDEVFDDVVYTGDLRRLNSIIEGLTLPVKFSDLNSLRTRGITNVFCECDDTDVSWLYLPEDKFSANRIIYTGSFSPANNRGSRMTCVVEFIYGEKSDSIAKDIAELPGNLVEISRNHVLDAYVIQNENTRDSVSKLNHFTTERNLHLLGRFGEWEYYNIDKCIESCMKLAKNFKYV